MDKQNSLFDAVVSQKLPEPKAKQRKSKEKKRSYSIGKPDVTPSKPEVNELEIPKVISHKKTFYFHRRFFTKHFFRIRPRRLPD